jgi:hypothetical protein
MRAAARRFIPSRSRPLSALPRRTVPMRHSASREPCFASGARSKGHCSVCKALESAWGQKEDPGDRAGVLASPRLSLSINSVAVALRGRSETSARAGRGVARVSPEGEGRSPASVAVSAAADGSLRRRHWPLGRKSVDGWSLMDLWWAPACLEVSESSWNFDRDPGGLTSYNPLCDDQV